MFLVIVGFILKLLGGIATIINTVKHFKQWRDKQKARLAEDNFIFLRRGMKPKLGIFRRNIYRLVRMPFPYLYMKERKIDQTAPSFLDEESIRRRVWKSIYKKIKR